MRGFPTDQGFDSIGLRRLSLKPGPGDPPQWRWISQRSTAVSMTSAKCLPIGKGTGCSRRSQKPSAPASRRAPRRLPPEQTRQRSGKLSRAEMLFIVVLFHLSPYKNFKVFYLYGIGGQYRACFDELPHYDRFVSLMPRLFVPLTVLLHGLSGEPTGVYFVDSTKLAACHNRRIHRHKVFDGLAARGKTSMGWFYSLKLHFVINHKGQIMALKITPGNTADSTVLDAMTRHLAGKLYADKGYIGRELFHKLWRRGLHLITSIRRNMRNYLIPVADKVMLRKRFLIETGLDTLKSEMGLEHSRHRSVINAMVHVLSCLVAYAFRPGKPSISLNSKHLQAYP